VFRAWEPLPNQIEQGFDVGLERDGQVQPDRKHRVVDAGDYQDRHRRPVHVPSQSLKQLDTVHRRHHQVENEQVRIPLTSSRELLEDRECGRTTRRLDHAVVIRPQLLRERDSKIVVIVDQ